MGVYKNNIELFLMGLNPFAKWLYTDGVDDFANDAASPAWLQTFPDTGVSGEVMFLAPEPHDTVAYMLYGGAENGTNRGVSIQITGTQWRLLLNDGGRWYLSAYSPFAAAQQVRAGFALDRAANVLRTYQNGLALGNTAGSVVSGTNQNTLHFGRFKGQQYYYRGSIYYARFWRQKLTDAEFGAVSGQAVPAIAPHSHYRAEGSGWRDIVNGTTATLNFGATIQS